MRIIIHCLLLTKAKRIEMLLEMKRKSIFKFLTLMMIFRVFDADKHFPDLFNYLSAV